MSEGAAAKSGDWGRDLIAPGHPDDIFLSPHSDDICYSLGVFALRRRIGTLLTVFPVSNHCVDAPTANPPGLRSVTQRRLGEDLEFAAACGLTARYLDFACAQARGQPPFDVRHCDEVARQIERDLSRALVGPTLGRDPQLKRWLFCPAGIGGHVDHLAVLRVVLAHFPRLEQVYRIAFYEDLHYAADPERRRIGLERLSDLSNRRPMARFGWGLDEAQQTAKLALVRLYRSQLTPQFTLIAAFTPAAADFPAPHEAVWVPQSDWHHRPG